MQPTDHGESTPRLGSGTIEGPTEEDASVSGAPSVEEPAASGEDSRASIESSDTHDPAVADTHVDLRTPRSSPTSRERTVSDDALSSSPHRRVVGVFGRVDNYRIIDELGSGGMAVVYRAEDERLKRQVALKILHDHIAGRAENRERFEREARAVARLEHPNIMSVYGFSSPSAPVGYIAAELIEGETLRSFVDRRGFAFPEVAAMVCLQLADALAHAHEEGIIHRDFKPENVMLSRTGVPKLMDFGLARLLDHQTLTMTGAVLGSPAHMSPEAIDGSPVDERVDIFAFGTVLYYAATRRLPFDGRNPAVILNAILSGTFADPTMVNPRIGARLARIIERCLETDPADRYPTVRALQADLGDYLSKLGFDDIRGELAQFIEDPDAYEKMLDGRLVRRLEELAEEAVEARQMASAIAYCDQLLAIRENHPAALRILGNVETRRKARAGVVLVAVLALVGAAIVLWPDPPPAPVFPEIDAGAPVAASELAWDVGAHVHDRARNTAVGIVSAPTVRRAVDALHGAHAVAGSRAFGIVTALHVTESAGGVAFMRAASDAARIAERLPRPPAVDRPAERPGERPAGTVEPASEGSGQEVVAVVPTRTVILNIWPLTTVVRVDGRDIGSAVDVASGIELPLGPHEIELKIPGLQGGRLRTRIEVSEGGRNDFDFRVDWPPAVVTFAAAERGTVVFEGRSYSTDDRLEVAILGDEPTREIELVFLPPEGEPSRRRVTVRTEQEIPVPAPF